MTALLFASDLAIRVAIETGNLKIAQAHGRLGAYWTISDEHGLIEVAMNRAELDERLARFGYSHP